MKNNTMPPKFAVGTITSLVCQRLETLVDTDQFDDLCCYAAEKVSGNTVKAVVTSSSLANWVPTGRTTKCPALRSKPCCCHAARVKPEWIRYDYYDLKVAPRVSMRTRTQMWVARHVAEQVDLAEAILFFVAVLRYPAPKPIVAVWGLIEWCWARWDSIDAELEEGKRQAREARSRGGKQRHRNFEELKMRTVEYLVAKAPTDGWLSKAHAGDSLAPLLVQIAAERGYAVSRDRVHWSRTIQRFIREEPRAKEAYEAKRAERRCNRKNDGRTRVKRGNCPKGPGKPGAGQPV